MTDRDIIDAEFTVISPPRAPFWRRREFWLGPDRLAHLTPEERVLWRKQPFWTRHRIDWRYAIVPAVVALVHLARDLAPH